MMDDWFSYLQLLMPIRQLLMDRTSSLRIFFMGIYSSHCMRWKRLSKGSIPRTARKNKNSLSNTLQMSKGDVPNMLYKTTDSISSGIQQGDIDMNQGISRTWTFKLFIHIHSLSKWRVFSLHTSDYINSNGCDRAINLVCFMPFIIRVVCLSLLFSSLPIKLVHKKNRCCTTYHFFQMHINTLLTPIVCGFIGTMNIHKSWKA